MSNAIERRRHSEASATKCIGLQGIHDITGTDPIFFAHAPRRPAPRSHTDKPADEYNVYGPSFMIAPRITEYRTLDEGRTQYRRSLQRYKAT